MCISFPAVWKLSSCLQHCLWENHVAIVKLWKHSNVFHTLRGEMPLLRMACTTWVVLEVKRLWIMESRICLKEVVDQWSQGSSKMGFLFLCSILMYSQLRCTSVHTTGIHMHLCGGESSHSWRNVLGVSNNQDHLYSSSNHRSMATGCLAVVIISINMIIIDQWQQGFYPTHACTAGVKRLVMVSVYNNIRIYSICRHVIFSSCKLFWVSMSKQSIIAVEKDTWCLSWQSN